jgi:hypothetical protein
MAGPASDTSIGTAGSATDTLGIAGPATDTSIGTAGPATDTLIGTAGSTVDALGIAGPAIDTSIDTAGSATDTSIGTAGSTTKSISRHRTAGRGGVLVVGIKTAGLLGAPRARSEVSGTSTGTVGSATDALDITSPATDTSIGTADPEEASGAGRASEHVGVGDSQLASDTSIGTAGSATDALGIASPATDTSIGTAGPEEASGAADLQRGRGVMGTAVGFKAAGLLAPRRRGRCSTAGSDPRASRGPTTLSISRSRHCTAGRGGVLVVGSPLYVCTGHPCTSFFTAPLT